MSERRRGRRWSDERGVTLVELLVVLTLTGVVLGIVTTGAISFLRATNQVDVRTDNVDQARLAVTALSRDLRAAAPAVDGASAFSVADADRAVFHARIGEGATPVLLEIAVDGDDRIVESLTPPTIGSDGTVTYDPAQTRERFVASFLFNGPDEPVLSYGTFVDGEVVWLAPPLDDLDRRRIRVVAIELRMARDRAERVAPQVVRTEVRVPNLRDGS